MTSSCGGSLTRLPPATISTRPPGSWRYPASPGPVRRGRPKPICSSCRGSSSPTHEFRPPAHRGAAARPLEAGPGEVRRLAEQAALGVSAPPAGKTAVPPHPYSEALWTHLGTAVETADRFRRDGEDRLFASPENAHARARQDLDAAAQQYQQNVLVQARVLQAAYAVRDESLRSCPCSRGGSRRCRPRRLTPRPKRKWCASCGRNSTRSPTGSTGRTDPPGRTPSPRRSGPTSNGSKQDYRDHCQKLADKDLQVQWEAIEQVMAVPPMLIPPDLRKTLVESGRRQAAKLTAAWMANPKAVTPRPAAAVDDAKAAWHAQAVQQADLAAAVLGDLPNNQPADRKGKLLAPTVCATNWPN